MTAPNGDLPLIRQYRDWLQSDTDHGGSTRERFFTQGLVILDTNILLNLYEYTPSARSQVFSALERVKDRLWLPHQVGLEFVRNRHRVIAKRVKALNDAPTAVTQKLREANKSILAASSLVQELLIRYAQDTQASESLRAEISSQSVEELLSSWRDTLLGHVSALKNDHDLALSTVTNDDPVLPQVAELFGDRVATPPEPSVIRHRVEEAASYRFPNRIPPGYMDAGKESPLNAAGDYLLWEEVVQHVQHLPETLHVLFVSGDLKDDWYEAPEPGRGRRPWPSLSDELRSRAAAELRIETPKEFFMGVKRYLDVDIADTTYEEIGRAADIHLPAAITEYKAAQTTPPINLVAAAYEAAGLITSSLREELESPPQRIFQWWLIGVTEQLKRRQPTDVEVPVDIVAASRETQPPGRDWVSGKILRFGEWPYRTSSWLAPWFAELVSSAPEEDRLTLLRLAAQQIEAQTQQR